MARTRERAQQIAYLIARNRLGYETNDKVTRGQFRQGVSKSFTHTSPDTVAIHRARKQSLGDDHAQPGIPHLIGPRHYHQVICSGALVFSKDPIEIGLIDQTRITQTHATRPVGRRVDQLYSQTRAALGATCVNHGTARLGFHAGTETVGALATDGRRLVSTFHGISFRLAPAHPAGTGKPNTKNLLKNRILDPPHWGDVKFWWQGILVSGTACLWITLSKESKICV